MRIEIDERELMKALDKKLRHITSSIIMDAKDITRERDIIATGLYLKSFHSLKEKDCNYLIWNEAPYSKIVEFGSEPHSSPFNEILKWVMVKKKEEGEEAVRSAWAIVKHIEKYGLEPRFVLSDAIQRTKRRLKL